MILWTGVASLALTLVAATPSAAAFQPERQIAPDLRPGWEQITESKARRYLAELTSPKMAGRGTGEPGYFESARFMAAQFRRIGLKPAGDRGTFFQDVPFFRWRSAASDTTVRVGNGAPVTDVLLVTTSHKEETFRGKAVYIRAEDLKPEVQLPDLDNKIVIVQGNPGWRVLTRVFRARPEALFFSQTTLLKDDWTVSQARPRDVPVRQGVIAESFVRRVFGTSQEAFTESKEELTVTAKGKLEEIQVPNVMAVLEGSDPALAPQYVGIGAHLDHLGIENGVVYPGADDDGSGNTALLLTAEALAKSKIKPKRSIVFMAFTGEEMGLLGSRFQSDNPFRPLSDMIALLQMDMVGRNSEGPQNGDNNRIDKAEDNRNSIRLVGSKRIATELDRIIQDKNRYVGFNFKYDAEDVYTRSDHYMFARKGVPVAFFFSGFHPDYHQPTDTIEKINFEKIVATARINYLVALELANRPTMLTKDVQQ